MKIFKLLFAVVAVTLVLSGCKYDFIVPEDVPDPDDPNAEQVSFSQEILPIFSAHSCTSCHDTGGQMPDLTAENAYSSINTTRYINFDTPEESLIYTRPHPSNTGSHPTYSEAQAAKLLLWINQGAKNN
jgi:hypothetical protein